MTPSSRSGHLSKTTIASAVCAGLAAWFSLGSLAVTKADATRRIGLLPPLWVLVLFMAGAVVIAGATRLSARASRPLFLAAFILLPWIPLPVPNVFLVWTGPAVRFIWAAIALTMIGGSPILRIWPTIPFLSSPRRASILAGAIAFVVFLSIHAGQENLPTGDEPHYLVIAQSLLLDRDMKVANNYERGDYDQYYGGWLRPHLSASAGTGAAYSVHAPGLPLIIAPAFAAGGYRGAVVWVALLTAIGTALVWLAAHTLTANPAAAWFSWAVVALTVPTALLGSLVYPDAIAGVALAAGLLALVSIDGSPNGEWPLWRSIALGAAIGTLPWLHTRLTLPAGILAALFALRVIGTRNAAWKRQLIAFCVPLAVSTAGWLVVFRLVYGTLNPSAPYGGVPLEIGHIGSGLLGLILDQEFGLLPNAPVHVVSLMGVWVLARAHRRLAIETLLLIVPYVIAASAYPMWWAGSSSPARFLTPIVFPLSVVAAMAWPRFGPGGKQMALTLLGASLLITAAFASGGEGVLAYNDAAGRARWLDWMSPLVDLPRAFPDVFHRGFLGPAAAWAVALSCWAVFGARDRRAAPDASAAPFAVPASFLAACMIAIAASWQIVQHAQPTATRAQLGLLRDLNPRMLPLGVQVFPVHLLAAADVPRRLAIGTSRLDAPPPATMLELIEVPAGRYYVRVTARAATRGELVLGIGYASVPVERWRLAGSAGIFPITLPIVASSLNVTGDDDAVRSVEQVVLVPAADMSVPPIAARARDAARYGSTVVYATDNRVSLQTDGFWVLGKRQPDVVVATDEPVESLAIEVHNGPVANRVRLRAGNWSTEHGFGPGETWSVRVPVAERGAATVMNIYVEHAFRPTWFDPGSRDNRLLGCWVVVR